MMKYIDRNHIPTDRRPLGYWLRAIEGPLRHTMREAFASFGVTRREWRTLTTLHAGPASAAEIEAALPPRREHGHGLRGHRTLEQLLETFVNRGWATLDRGSYALTAEGERIHDAVAEPVVVMIDRYVVGGFYRVHAERRADEAIAAPGSRYVPLAFAGSTQLPKPGAKPGASAPNRFYMYGVIGRLAMLAAAYELEATDPNAEVYE